MNSSLKEARLEELKRREEIDLAFEVAELIEDVFGASEVIWVWDKNRLAIPCVGKSIGKIKLVHDIVGGEVEKPSFSSSDGCFTTDIRTNIKGKDFRICFYEIRPEMNSECKMEVVDKVIPEHTEKVYVVSEECRQKLGKYLGVKKE